MKRGNLPPGPKPAPRTAVDGTLCPPGSEGSWKYRGLRPWLQTCRNGHPKPHPGRCVECRRASDKARDLSPQRAATKKAAYDRYKAKPESRAKACAYAKRRNARPDQKVDNAQRARELRQGIHRSAKDARAVAARLLALAQAKAAQTGYGIERVAYQEKR